MMMMMIIIIIIIIIIKRVAVAVALIFFFLLKHYPLPSFIPFFVYLLASIFSNMLAFSAAHIQSSLAVLIPCNCM